MINLVKEFHEVFGHSIEPTPTLPSPLTMEFRTNFIKEELQELNEAWANEDIVELADALGDLQYVLDGWFLNAGLHNHKEAIMKEIHRSNMSKVCKTSLEATLTIVTLNNRQADVDSPDKYHTEQHGDYYIVYRTSDHKVMKSIDYTPPDLKSILAL